MSDHTHATADHIADAKGRLRDLAQQMSGQPNRQPVAVERAVERTVDRADDWDTASAEALMQVYEGHESTVYYADPAPISTQAPIHSPAQRHAARGAITLAGNDAPPSVALADLAQDRAWLDDRFSDLAARLDDTMKRLDPAEQIAPLARRLDGLEGQLRSALGDDGRRDALAGLERQIDDVRRQLQAARDKLERLDGIEEKIGKLTSLAEAANDPSTHSGGQSFDIEALLTDAVERTAARFAEHVPKPGPIANFDELAERTAERTAERLAAVNERRSAPDGVTELRSMMAGYVDEYRREQSQTTAALATMQEALVQLIDRIDQYDEDAHAGDRDGAVPVQPVPDQFVEVADQRGDRSGRRTADAAVVTQPQPRPRLDAPAVIHVGPEPKPDIRADVNAPIGAASPPLPRPEPQLDTKPVSRKAVVADDAIATRTPRRVAATVVAEPELDPAAAAAAMAAERARIAAERATQSAPRRSVPREPDRSQEPGSTSADQVNAEAPAPQVKQRPLRKTAAASPNVVKRGLMVAGLAGVVIGTSALAHLYLSGRTTSAKMDDRVPSMSAGPKLSPRPQPTVSVTSGAPLSTQPSTITPPVDAAPMSTGGASQPSGLPTSNDVRPQPAAQRGPQPAPQLPPAAQPRAQPSSNALPDSFKPRSVPETVNEDLQSNLRSRSGTLNPTSAAVSGIALDTGTMPNPAELARQIAAPSGVAATDTQPSPTALPIRAEAQIDARSIDAMEPSSRGAVEMPPATVGPSSLRTAAQQGDPGAQFEVAARFAEGKGMKQDFQQAIVWYSRASQKGFVPAQYRLATLYERGLGTPADVTRAKVWYRRAADQGNVKSMHNLAVLAAGPQQAEPDYATALRWFTEAAERGLADSQFNLGVLTENGLGMAKDQQQAYKWFALAARSGDKDSARRRDQLAAIFTPDQARTAELLVSNWRAKPIDMKSNDPRAAGQAWMAEREASAQAAAQKQDMQRQQQQAAPMPPPPPAAAPPKAKAAKVTRG